MRILIAEDDTTSRLLLEATLQKLGHEVAAASNGQEAWEAFQRDYFPVVISDWMMPELDGPTLCRAIRRVHRDNYTMILVLTSLGGRTNYLQAMDAGADDFITKPIDEDQLAARLRVAERILRGGCAARPRGCWDQPVRVCPRSGRARFSGGYSWSTTAIRGLA
ncbi:MAG: response regulator, partial [Verrucomicrobia bacterium]|nr:response regulator [Verrucomicrobiota bacterium]